MKQTLNTIKNIFVTAVAMFAVVMMIFTIFSVFTMDQSQRSILGFRAMIVQSDSMAATDFKAGDIIFAKKTDPATLKEGDIITFISQDRSSYGETVTHKIRSLTHDAAGNPGFITYGTTTNSDDSTIVTYSYVQGKYIGKIPNAGTFFQYLRTTQGYILFIFIPFMLLILFEGINCIRLFRQYKREQQEELDAERKQLEDERKQTAEMLSELQALKQQLAEAGIQPHNIDTNSDKG
ncbi:MAG: signal peptidase I [Peptococcaceae bacterium]|nr:signal peptidase I [Peptococcaceae bacterium]